MKIIETQYDNLMFVGDIHGNFRALEYLLKTSNLNECTYIVCGDIGLGFENKAHYKIAFDRLSKVCAKRKNEILLIRGNHDSKEYFDGKRVNRKYIKAIPDYTVVKTPTSNILCIGGAISIDRMYRQRLFEKSVSEYMTYNECSKEEALANINRMYWEDEACYYDEKALNELKENDINIDIVCTHTCPSFVKPLNKIGISTWLQADENLDEDTTNERDIMDKIYNKLKSDGHSVNKWVYGHFHANNVEYVDDTMFIMLDMCRHGKCSTYFIYTYE